MNLMNHQVLPILIIGAYMFIPLYIGTKAGEKDLNTPEDFFIQSRSMSSVSVFFTVMATWWSAFAFLGSNAFFYSKGPVYWTTIGWDFLFGVLFYVIGKRIWFYGKLNHYITASDFFKDMYGSDHLGDLVAGIMLLFTIPYLQIQLAGGAYLIEVASNGLIPWEMGGLIFCLVIIIYVWTGGLRAVAWADIFYAVLILFSIIFSGIYIVSQVGGMTVLFKTLEQAAPEVLTLPGPQGDAGYMLWLAMFVMVPAGALMGPQLWTRMYAVKSPRIFDLIPFLLGFISIINIFPMLIGYSGIILEPNIINADTILPVLLYKYAPFALTSLILTGGAAAAMSTSNSQIHSISSVYAIDIHQKYINKKISNKRLMLVGRIAIVTFSILTYLMLLYIPGLLINIGLLAMSGTAQIIVPVCGALFWEKSNAKGAIAGLLGGLAVILGYMVLSSDLSIAVYPGIIALFVNTMIFVTVSRSTPSRDPELLSKFRQQKQMYREKFH
jgi:solute:Na+ symporter, SSS family